MAYIRMYILVVVGLLPLYLVRFEVLGISSNVFEVLALTVIAASVYSAWRSASMRMFFSLPPEASFRWGIACVFAGVGLSTLLNPTVRALGILKGWFVLPFLLFVAVRYLYQGDEAKKPLVAYGISGLIAACIALGYFAYGALTFDGRLQAFFTSPNYLAMYLAPALILCGAMTFGGEGDALRRRYMRVVGFGCMAMLSCVLLMTRSHGALLGLVGAIAVGWFYARMSKSARGVAIAVVVAFTTLLPYITVGIAPALLHAGIIAERSPSASRIMIWRTAIDIGTDHAVAGIGPGAFQEQYLAYQKNYPPYLEWAVPQPHNIYLAYWLETGALGLGGFLSLLYWFYKKYMLDPTTSGQGALAAIMAYILVHGAVDTTYWKNDLSVIFWLLLAAQSAVSGSQRAQNARD